MESTREEAGDAVGGFVGSSSNPDLAGQDHAEHSSRASAEDTSSHHLLSVELREGLEDLMEYFQQHRHEEPASSLEERYLLLISSYPSECLRHAVTLTDKRTDGTASKTGRLPIHLACDKGAPVSIVKSLLQADVQNHNGTKTNTILQPDTWGDLPIHIACSRAATSLSQSDTERYGRLQLLRGRDDNDGNNNNNIDNDNGNGNNNDNDNDDNDGGNRNPGVDNAVEIIRLLLEADTSDPKDSLSVKDVYESLPLHTAVRYNAPPKVIRLLLEAEGSNDRSVSSFSLYTEGLHGQFPLTVACRSGNPSPDVLRLLLETDDDHCARSNSCGRQRPSTVLHKDATGRLPIHVFMLRNTCPASLRILLNAMLGCSSNKYKYNQYHKNNNNIWHHNCGTIQPARIFPRNSILRLGLDVWKSQMLRDLIGAMDGSNGLYERDFTTRDKLDVICTELREWYETCVALELVAWKMGCERIRADEQQSAATLTPAFSGNNDNDNNNGNENENENENDNNTDSKPNTGRGRSEFRNHCRIVSGAEVIVPNVLSFLEHEPVDKIVNRFASYGYLGSADSKS